MERTMAEIDLEFVDALLITLDKIIRQVNKDHKTLRGIRDNPLHVNEDTGEIRVSLGSGGEAPDAIRKVNLFELAGEKFPGIALANEFFVKKNHGKVIDAVEKMSDEQKQELPQRLLKAIEDHYETKRIKAEMKQRLEDQKVKDFEDVVAEEELALQERKEQLAGMKGETPE